MLVKPQFEVGKGQVGKGRYRARPGAARGSLREGTGLRGRVGIQNANHGKPHHRRGRQQGVSALWPPLITVDCRHIFQTEFGAGHGTGPGAARSGLKQRGIEARLDHETAHYAGMPDRPRTGARSRRLRSGGRAGRRRNAAFGRARRGQSRHPTAGRQSGRPGIPDCHPDDGPLPRTRARPHRVAAKSCAAKCCTSRWCAAAAWSPNTRR